MIVTADDVGASSRVNDATFDAIERGQVTSASILATGPACADAVQRAGHWPRCSFGAHLDLVEFAPLTDGHSLTPLLSDGRFYPVKAREARLAPRLQTAVYREWCAQVERLQDLGLSVSHLDSHHHVHTRPGLFPVLKRLQARYGIRRVRITRNLYREGAEPAPLLRIEKHIWNGALRWIYRTRTASAFTDPPTLACSSPRTRGRHPTIEVMVHPGREEATGPAAVTTGEWLPDTIRPFELISHLDL